MSDLWIVERTQGLKLCRFYAQGFCNQRERCPFVHARENRPNEKKAPCKFFASSGTCRFGEKCNFSHEGGETHMKPKPKAKASFCLDFLRGKCELGDACPKRHEKPRARKTEPVMVENIRAEPKIKRKFCIGFLTGKCTLGDSCPNLHEKPRAKLKKERENLKEVMRAQEMQNVIVVREAPKEMEEITIVKNDSEKEKFEEETEEIVIPKRTHEVEENDSGEETPLWDFDGGLDGAIQLKRKRSPLPSPRDKKKLKIQSIENLMSSFYPNQ